MVMLMGGSIFAQSGTSGIDGTVTDQSGAVVPGATVTIINVSKGFTRSVTTEDDGRYSFLGLPPAAYRVEVEASNFKQAVSGDVRALVDSKTTFDVILEAGDVAAETVTVTTNDIESIVNTQDASIGNNFVAQQIIELPSNLRRVENLLTLQPGVTEDGEVAGARGNQTNYTLDGVDINDSQGGALAEGLALRLSTEAVEEFRITTTNANASQGRSSGAQASLVTKSGTNDFHGSAFYYRRTTAFSANDFFNNKSGAERPSLERDIYGGTIGGRIIKDKAFFFYSFERQNDQREESINRRLPLPHMGNGELRFEGTGPGCVGGICRLSMATLNSIFPKVGINPAAVALFKDVTSKYPSNNTDLGDGVNTGGFRFNSPTSTKENAHVAKLDFNLSDRHLLSVRGNYQWDNSSGTSYLPDTLPTAFWDHPTALAASHTWTISDNKINTLRYGLSRQAFSNQGNLSGSLISFREVYNDPVDVGVFVRTGSRVSSIHSFYDDFTWIKGNHTLQFGGTFRLVRNKRSTLAGTFDTANANVSWYIGLGTPELEAIKDAGYTINSDNNAVLHPLTALTGRLSSYTANYVFDKDGNVQEPGTPINRNFATEEYEFYGMDSWKLLKNLTLTLGLRYSLSRPVYEQNGFQVIPSIPLGDFFANRVASAKIGIPTNDTVNYRLGGPVNKGPGFYKMDWNNFQPRLAVAWTPSFEKGWLRTLFGEEGVSTIRGGFSITNDAFGQQLAVSFDGATHIGFTASTVVDFGTHNISTNLAPRYTGPNMDIRSFGLPKLTLDLNGQASGFQGIKSALDSNITTPVHYVWNVSYGRNLPKGMHIEATYTGRRARDLFARKDVVAWNNITDPASGIDWYTAAGMLENMRRANVPIENVRPIPFFENLFKSSLAAEWGQPTNTQAVYSTIARAAVGGLNFTGSVMVDEEEIDLTDWTMLQRYGMQRHSIIPNIFSHPQYTSLFSWGTYAKSNYHAGILTFRQRLGTTLTYDINYTLSRSMDDASEDDGLIINPLIPEGNYRYSDFDARHTLNANFIFHLPFGEGRRFLSNMSSLANAVLGGWQLAGIYRFSTGTPNGGPTEYPRWSTNWSFTSSAVLTRPLKFKVDRNTGQAFADPVYAMQSFRSSKPGEVGSLGVFRTLHTRSLDMTLSKSFTMPWSETHKLQFKWDVFNVANFQQLTISGTTGRYAIPIDPDLTIPNDNFGVIFNGTAGAPRRMQFGLRYEF